AIPLEQPAVRRVARCAVGVRPVHVLPSGTTGRRNGERRREQRSPPPPLPHTGAVIIQAARRQSIAGVVPGDGLGRRATPGAPGWRCPHLASGRNSQMLGHGSRETLVAAPRTPGPCRARSLV